MHQGYEVDAQTHKALEACKDKRMEAAAELTKIEPARLDPLFAMNLLLFQNQIIELVVKMEEIS